MFLKEGHERRQAREMSDVLRRGGDAGFRRFIQDLYGLTTRLQLIRERLSTKHGISGAQFGILLGIRELQEKDGVTVSRLARYLHLRGPFVTNETRKLQEEGLLRKRADRNDRRGVRISLTKRGADLIERMTPLVTELNLEIFGSLTKEQYETVKDVIAELVLTSEAGLVIIQHIGRRELEGG